MKGKLLVIVIIVFFLLVYHRWIFSHSILTFGDWYYFYKETLLTTRMSYFNIWVSDFNLGSIVVGIAQAPTWGAYGLLAKLFNIDYPISLRVVHLFPIIIFTPLSSFILTKYITKKTYAAIAGMIVYSFNSYFLVLQTGHLTLMAAFSLLPLIVYFFIRSLSEKSFFFGSVSALILSISCAYEPRVAYQTLVILFIYYIFSLFGKTKERLPKKLLNNSLYAAFPIILFVLINFYWILGLSQTGSISSNEFFNRSLFGNEFLNSLYAFSLFHPFWTGNVPAIFTLQAINPLFWLAPIFAFIGLYLGRKKLIILYFGVIALLGIFLTKQSSIPFEHVYLWLYTHFPGFNAYREATKFFAFIVIGYSVLISVFFGFILDLYEKGKIRKYIMVGIFFLVTGPFLLNTKPLITGEIQTMFKPREIPKDYLAFKDQLLSEKDYSRILWVPTFSRWGLITPEHPEVGLIDLLNSNWNTYVPSNLNTDNYVEGEIMVRMMQKPFFNSLLDQSSIKYVVIPIEDKENDDNFYQYYGKSRQYYIDNISKLSYLKRVNTNFKNIIVYKNSSFRPHVYLSLDKETITNTPSIQPVSYRMISPTKYSFTIANQNKPIYLYLTDAFNRNWTLSLANSSHEIESSKTAGGMNSFYLSQGYLSQIGRSEGNNMLSGTLYFKAQDAVNKGMSISIISLVFLLVYQAIYLFKRQLVRQL